MEFALLVKIFGFAEDFFGMSTEAQKGCQCCAVLFSVHWTDLIVFESWNETFSDNIAAKEFYLCSLSKSVWKSSRDAPQTSLRFCLRLLLYYHLQGLSCIHMCTIVFLKGNLKIKKINKSFEHRLIGFIWYDMIYDMIFFPQWGHFKNHSSGAQQSKYKTQN